MTGRIRQCRLANDVPAPNIDITINFSIRACEAVGSDVIAAINASAARVMNIGGEVGADQGFPDFRVWPRVDIMTIGFPAAWEKVVVRAVARSDWEVGSAGRT